MPRDPAFNVPTTDVGLGSSSARISGERSRLTARHSDPAHIHTKIVSIQTVHYLVLSIFIPPLLTLFAEPNSLDYEGGAANVGASPCFGVPPTDPD